MAKTRVQGTGKLIAQLREFSKEGELIAAGVVEATAREISHLAKEKAPANDGALRQVIIPNKENKLTWETVSHAPYSGYVEFGTGVKVSVPAEMRDQANEIKNSAKGNFQDALISIKDWCKSKGIDERAAYPILMSILDEGLRPRPFLYPAFVEGSKKMVVNLKKEYDALVKRFNAQK